MKKYILLLTLLYPKFLYCQTPSLLEHYHHTWTNYYFQILSKFDDIIPCEQNCTHSEHKKIKYNSLRLIMSFKSTKDNQFKPALNLRANIRLPKITKKLEIAFSKQTLDSFTNKQIDQENESMITDDQLRVGLRYYFQRTEDFTFYTKLGFKLHSPFGFYQELSIEKRYLLYRDFLVSLEGNLYYYIHKRYFAKALRASLYQFLNEIFTLEQTNEYHMNYENEHKKYLEHYFKLHHQFSKRDKLSYWLTYATVDYNNHHFIKNWQGISVSYTHYLKKWLYINTIPRMLQRKETHFETEFAFTINLGIKLGPES